MGTFKLNKVASETRRSATESRLKTSVFKATQLEMKLAVAGKPVRK